MAEEKPEDNRVANFLSRNAEFAQTYKPAPPFAKLLDNSPVHPRIIIIISCFNDHVDPRKFFGLKLGDAVLINNAGGRVNADALRSVIVLDDLLVVGTVIVEHHTDCGLIHTSDESIRAKLKKRAPEMANEIDGMDFQLFKDVHQSVRHDMSVVNDSPFLDVQVLGYIFDITHGRVKEVKI